jgi:peroxiredoxin
MKEWFKTLGVDPAKIQMLPDYDASFHRQLGLLQHLDLLGERCLRYSLLLDNGIVRHLNVDDPGDKSYKISGPATLLEEMRVEKEA